MDSPPHAPPSQHEEEGQQVGGAAEGAAHVLKLDPDWSAERDISDTGAFARQAELDLYLDGIRKAGLPVCASLRALEQRPEMKRLPICEQARSAL